MYKESVMDTNQVLKIQICSHLLAKRAGKGRYFAINILFSERKLQKRDAHVGI
jgi:Tfp pilus assembly ATPase PilU